MGLGIESTPETHITSLKHLASYRQHYASYISGRGLGRIVKPTKHARTPKGNVVLALVNSFYLALRMMAFMGKRSSDASDTSPFIVT